jgi:hypothetical protein
MFHHCDWSDCEKNVELFESFGDVENAIEKNGVMWIEMVNVQRERKWVLAVGCFPPFRGSGKCFQGIRKMERRMYGQNSKNLAHPPVQMIVRKGGHSSNCLDEGEVGCVPLGGCMHYSQGKCMGCR